MCVYIYFRLKQFQLFIHLLKLSSDFDVIFWKLLVLDSIFKLPMFLVDGEEALKALDFLCVGSSTHRLNVVSMLLTTQIIPLFIFQYRKISIYLYFFDNTDIYA